jgi:uncharacterized cupin superfamily protein
MIVDPECAPTSAGDRGLETLRLSVAGGLTQFGAYIATLAPGGWSSHRHWHEAEDEFVYVLEGEATVVDDDGTHLLSPGDAACWRHGDPNAHHITNARHVPLRYLVVGSRAASDVSHYPDSGWRQVNGTARWQILDADGTVRREGDLPAELRGLPPAWGVPFDPARSARRIVRAGTVEAVTGNPYPPPYDALGGYRAWPISDAGGLTQFGAFTEMLEPGSLSGHRHWHAAEDEFLYVLDGTATVVEDDGPHDLEPGGCACWPAGVANGHQVINRTARPLTYLVAGTRLPSDEVTYSDVDLRYVRIDGISRRTRKDGTALS